VTIALGVGAIDLIVKEIMSRWLEIGEERWLLDGWFGLELTRNPGIAFGIGHGARWTALLVVLGVVILVALAFRIGLVTSGLGSVALGLALGGAVGNVVDRVGDGSVTDFLAVGPWPRFNVADSTLTIGLALLVFQDRFSSGGDRS
jgi:signal peptidase II